MSNAATPSRSPTVEQTLRRLFWKLLFRGRSAGQAQSQTKKQVGLWASIVAYVFIGFVLSLSAQRMEMFGFAATLHGLTLMFASMTLATSAGTMLFMREEAEILLHRPVSARQMLRAKAEVLVAFSLLLAFALNLAGFIFGITAKGGGWRFLLIHSFSITLLMTFSAGAIILVYNACLKWFGRERLDNLLTSMQTLLTIVLIGGSQLMPHLMRGTSTVKLENTAWIWALPPAWFGALDAWFTGQMPLATAALPAALALGVTGLTLWLAFGVLGSAYGEGLTALNETQATVSKPGKPRWLSRMLTLPPFSWYLSNAAEKQTFLLTSAYLVRDREVKLKIYPGIIPLIIMPVVVTFSTASIKSDTVSSYLQTFVSAYLFMVPIQAMALLQRSEHWRASAIFHTSPLAHWAPLFHGSRKAVLLWLVLPAMVLQSLAMTFLHRDVQPLIMTLPALLLLPVVSRIPGIMDSWLPLSKSSEEAVNKASGCVLMIMTVGVASIVGGLATFAYFRGLFTPFLAAEAALCALVTWSFNKAIASKPWPIAGEG